MGSARSLRQAQCGACLGNVRVVLTNEDEVEMLTFLATLEDVHSFIEEEDFDRLDDTRAELPQNYPVDGSVTLNERIAFLIAEGEMTMGPSLAMNVRPGEKVTASVEYFYEEDAPGATYDNLGFFVDEILVALVSSAAGVVQVGEGTLANIASGNTVLANQLYQLLALNIDTTDISRPHGYLVYVAYDNHGQIVGTNSGAIQVTDPNQLRTILTNEITIAKDGFMHIYVSNGSSAKGISFDNFLVRSARGATRQMLEISCAGTSSVSSSSRYFSGVNHYYPYGLPLAGIDGNHDDYLNKYTGKEHQTGEFHTTGNLSRGIEMFDFHARFFEPQLARWVVLDHFDRLSAAPAMQFSNPYLGIGNNPVMYVDPNGEIAFMAVVGIFAGVQLGADMIRNDFQMNIGEIGMSVGLGALQGALAASGAGGLAAYAGKNAGLLTLGSAVAGQINIPVIESENFSLSVSPSLATGTNGVRLGANAFASYRNGDFSISGGYSLGRNFSSWDLSEQMAEAKWSSISSISAGINGTDGGFNLGLTKFGGNYPSTVGRVGFSTGRFGFSHENDFLAPNNQDKYRTGRLGFSWQATDDLTLTAGFEVFTGNPIGTEANPNAKSGTQYVENVALRNGISSIGVQYRGNGYRIGWNSEGARAKMQNGWHDSMDRKSVQLIPGIDGPSPWFKRMSYSFAPYTYFGNINPFTGYGF